MNQSTYRCTRCETTKSVSEFGKNSRSPSGLKSWCRPCSNAYTKDWLTRNPEKLDRQRAGTAAWRNANPERMLMHASEYRHRNKDAVQARKKAPENRAKERAARDRRYAEDPSRYERARVAHKAWRDANPVKIRDIERRSGAKRRARKKAAPVAHFTKAQLASRMQAFGNACWMCGGDFDHIDHVKPLSAGGPHMLANLRPACATCNLTKSGKWFGVAQLHRFQKK